MENSDIHKGRRQRIFRKYIDSDDLSDFDSFEIAELLLYYVVQRCDVSKIAKKIIEKYGIDGLLNGSKNEVDEEYYIDCDFFRLLRELSDYYYELEVKERVNEIKNKCRDFRKLSEIVNYCRGLLSDEEKEVLYAVALDKNYMMINQVCITQNIDSEIHIPVKELMNKILADGCSYVFFTHNHPSGNYAPSSQDIMFTNEAAKIFGLIGIRVIEHVIVSRENFFSFRANNICL